MNVFDGHPFKVILDYGHNPAAVQAMADLVTKLECTGRRICVLAAPGDRRDEDIRAIAKIGAKAFDRIILRRDDDFRGRGPDEVPRMLEKTLLDEGYPKEKIQVIPDEQEAIAAALNMAGRGDLLLVFADMISRSWKQIIYFKPEGEEARRPRRSPSFGPSSSAQHPAASKMGRPGAQEKFSGELIQDELGCGWRARRTTSARCASSMHGGSRGPVSLRPVSSRGRGGGVLGSGRRSERSL